jgi:RNA polymerase sigma-70 factor, ECF subfamily
MNSEHGRRESDCATDGTGSVPVGPSTPSAHSGARAVSRDVMLRASRGDRDAQDLVFREYTAPLSRFASRLLPPSVRGITDTEDVVQDVLANTVRRLASIECEDDGALVAYLRRAVRHRIVDAIRRVGRQPLMNELSDDRPAPGPSPLDAAIRAQNDRRIQAALGRLTSRDRQAVVLRLRCQMSYEEIGERLGSPTPNAARVAVRRAVERLAKALLAANRPSGCTTPIQAQH